MKLELKDFCTVIGKEKNMRIQDFLTALFDTSLRARCGNWVFFRDSNPESLVSIRYDDEQDGAVHPPTVVIVTPDMIKVQPHYGAFNSSHFERKDGWNAIKRIKDITQI